MKLFIITYWWLLLVLFALGGCQRTIYQGQVTTEDTQQILLPATTQKSASITIVASPLVQANKGYFKAPQQEHRSVQQSRRMHHKIRLPLIRASATARTLIQHSCSPPQEEPVTKPVRYRSRGIALLLAILSLTYLPLSLHNFYLGYYGRGALAIAAVILGTYLIVFAFLGSIFSGAALLSLGLLGLGILGGWFVWQIIDLVRIITKDLKPKNGDYYPQFFQTNPSTGNTPRTD